MDKPKSKRGFASMDPERRREVARKGGQSVPASKRTWSDPLVASAAGRKGGVATKASRQLELDLGDKA